MARNGKPDEDTSRAQVIDDWRRLFGHPPPKYLSLGLMHSTLEWERQAKATAGLAIDVKRALEIGGRSKGSIPTTDLKQGVTLVREWNGRTYQVNVLEQGFRMDGKEYASLTAIAKKITGTNWSGPRFFGLTTKRVVQDA